jgi:XTP/dITP diphosphohydrolase
VRVYCATTNAGKLREFRLAFQDAIHLEVLPGLANIPTAPETGDTFEANALQKVLYYAPHCDGYLFAEDSGLEVDGLDRRPGVYSARFAGPNATDQSNNQLLLERMHGMVDRSARFVCAIALAESGRLVRTFVGDVKGRIVNEPRGSGGFGYDPLFYYEPFGCTFGEVSLEEKMKVSHRSMALKALLDFIVTMREQAYQKR